jgi:hypothetical protein
MSFILALHGVAVAAAALLLPLSAAALVAAGLALSVIVQLRKERAKGKRVVVVQGDGSLHLEADRDGAPPALRGMLIGHRLIALRRIGPGPWATRELLLAPDSATDEGLRAIRRAIALATGTENPV